jgi:hypothetical protein
MSISRHCSEFVYYEYDADGVSCFRAEAKKVLQAQSDSDPSELQYLLEYYSLVREGKTNYISTNTFHDVTGVHPLEPPEFFKAYANEFLPKHADKKMKMNGK